MNYDFSSYGFSTNNPPPLMTSWHEEKRVVDLSGNSYVFITSLNKTPWRQRERFPNANKCTIKIYSHKYGERRIKNSLHWMKGTNTRWGTGVVESKIFGEKW
jgi:hypothetical protein